MTFAVLKYNHAKTNDFGKGIDGQQVRLYDVSERIHLGYAADMQDALRKFPRCKANGYSPILEDVGTLQ